MKKYPGKIIDMHCHVLPGVDDGSECLEQSLNMLRISAGEGVGTVVATPHLVCDGSEKLYAARIRKAFMELKSIASERGISVRLALGFELLLSASLPHVDNIGEYTIEGTNRLLVEPQSSEPVKMLDELLYGLGHTKLELILAHPERNAWLAGNTSYLRQLAAKGVLMQINAGSVTGQWGRGVTRAVRKMARQGLVHLIGSDAHSDGARKPQVNDAVSTLYGWLGEKAAADIACDRADSLLHYSDGIGACL
jgi:protein-tyrosine phosphatase